MNDLPVTYTNNEISHPSDIANHSYNAYLANIGAQLAKHFDSGSETTTRSTNER